MYQALYRKYRPKTLDDIYGQDIIVKIIKNSIENNQINHAYLFAGPRGTGKTSIAKIFAKIINCENPDKCTPCGKCTSCLQENNSDIIEIDAASNNGVDEIRELKNKINLLPAYGKYKVYIIDEVHMLTPGAFNALLKTLEEPPAHVIFILATTDPHKVIETIISRCQRLDFKKITNEAIIQNLTQIAKKENIEIEPQALEEIAKLSDGGMRDSVGMLDQARAYTENKITVKDIHDINGTLTEENIKEFLENIIEGKLDILLKQIDKFNEEGKNFIKLLEELIEFLRNIIIYKEAPKYLTEKVQNIDNYKNISSKITLKDLFNYIEILNKYSLELKNNTNTRLLFELAIIKLISIKNVEKTQTIVENSPKNVENPKISPKKNEQTHEHNTIPLAPTQPKPVKQKNNIILEKLKKVRIDNTLSKFNKANTKEIQKKLEKLNDMLIKPEYSESASILLDGTLKASSDENLLFVYKTTRSADLFNENLIILEETLEKILNKKYNLIATDIEEWEILKNEFNRKLRPFIYQKENFNIEDIFKEETKIENINEMFEDIIEYN